MTVEGLNLIKKVYDFIPYGPRSDEGKLLVIDGFDVYRKHDGHHIGAVAKGISWTYAVKELQEMERDN